MMLSHFESKSLFSNKNLIKILSDFDTDDSTDFDSWWFESVSFDVVPVILDQFLTLSIGLHYFIVY